MAGGGRLTLMIGTQPAPLADYRGRTRPFCSRGNSNDDLAQDPTLLLFPKCLLDRSEWVDLGNGDGEMAGIDQG